MMSLPTSSYLRRTTSATLAAETGAIHDERDDSENESAHRVPGGTSKRRG